MSTLKKIAFSLLMLAFGGTSHADLVDFPSPQRFTCYNKFGVSVEEQFRQRSDIHWTLKNISGLIGYLSNMEGTSERIASLARIKEKYLNYAAKTFRDESCEKLKFLECMVEYNAIRRELIAELKVEKEAFKAFLIPEAQEAINGIIESKEEAIRRDEALMGEVYFSSEPK